jgi:hypothetical protein
MLQAMCNAMIDSLKNAKATEEIIGAYKQSWNDTLAGHARQFPCPACFMAGVKDSALKALPAKANTHYVKCLKCNTQYSYVEEDF